jgi:hypothetical protein
MNRRFVMIVKEYGKWYIECDICGCYVPGFISFDDAVDYAKENGWTFNKNGKEWENYCPECAKEK